MSLTNHPKGDFGAMAASLSGARRRENPGGTAKRTAKMIAKRIAKAEDFSPGRPPGEGSAGGTGKGRPVESGRGSERPEGRERAKAKGKGQRKGMRRRESLAGREAGGKENRPRGRRKRAPGMGEADGLPHGGRWGDGGADRPLPGRAYFRSPPEEAMWRWMVLL
jgi:hypothetical protein